MSHISKFDSRKKFSLFVVLLVGLTACTTASRPDLSGMSFSSDPLLGKVIWHDLITEDMQAAQNFYGELLGWTFEKASVNRGEEYVIARKGDIVVAGLVGIDAPDDDQKYSRWLPYLSVDDVDAALARSVDAGASIAVEAQNVSIGRVAAIIDPQGAVIGLARSSIGDPDDATTAAAPGRPVWNELLADNPAAAGEFYGSLANFQSRTIQRHGGEYTVLSSDGKDRLGVFQKPTENEYTPTWITAFGVEDPAAAAARVESLGGSIILPVSAELRDGTTAVVTDPSGAILVLRHWSLGGAE